MKKVLLIRLSSLGDVIFNIPLANVLKSNGYEVSWLVSEKGFDVVKDNPVVDKTILIPFVKWKKTGYRLKNIIEYFKIIKQIRNEKYDIVIDTQMMFKSLFVMLLCGAKRRICFEKGIEFSHFGGNEKVKYAPGHRFDTNVILQYMRFAKYLNLEGAENIKFTLPKTSIDTKNKVNDLLKNIDNSKPMVVISPATTWKLKHWNKDYWKVVIDSIKDKCSLVFTGTSADKELISYIGGDSYINLAGKTGIKDLIEIYSRAKLVISPDSGSANLARATQKTTVISIFCCTPSTMYGACGGETNYYAVQDKITCKPCRLKKCPLKDKRFEQCVDYPLPSKIINIVNKVLQN